LFDLKKFHWPLTKSQINSCYLTLASMAELTAWRALSSVTPTARRSRISIPATTKPRREQAKMLTKDEEQRIAVNIVRLPELLGKGEPD
jgi:hypothetical protein